jgi:uncharacterized protein (DUF1697 family)
MIGYVVLIYEGGIIMVYVALLRGINVGGNNKIDMKVLKKTFERLGMKSVVTYINTGNIIFTSKELPRIEISSVVEQGIYEDFGLKIKVVARGMDDYREMMDALPNTWQNDDQMKSDVMFLWDDVDDKSVLEQVIIVPEVDRVLYTAGAIMWSVDRADQSKSGMNKLVGTKLYKQMTIRNVNTARKLYELMQAASKSESN